MRKKETKLSFFTDDTAEIKAANEVFLVIRNIGERELGKRLQN